MQQTFEDMLDGETSKLGRFRVWTRTLVDLPIDSSKEHLTNGKDFYMNRNTKLILAGSLVVVVIVGLAAFWKGNLYARGNVGIERVTPAQLADAMQQDGFYSTYGDAVVLFNGKISAIQTKNGVGLVSFATGRPYSLTCQFVKVTAAITNKQEQTNSKVSQVASSLTVGQTISVAAPAGSAERESKGVLLHNCLRN